MGNFILDNPWIVFIGLTLFNAYMLKERVQTYIEEKPELKSGYDKMIKAFTIFVLIPFLIMGAGQLSGMSKGMGDYLHIWELNVAGLIFHAYITGLLLWYTSWVLFRKGAEQLSQYPGFYRIQYVFSYYDVTSVFWIKVITISIPVLYLLLHLFVYIRYMTRYSTSLL